MPGEPKNRHDIVTSSLVVEMGVGHLVFKTPENPDVIVNPGDKFVVDFSDSGVRIMGQASMPARIGQPGGVP